MTLKVFIIGVVILIGLSLVVAEVMVYIHVYI